MENFEPQKTQKITKEILKWPFVPYVVQKL